MPDYSNIFKSLTYDRLSKYRENPSLSIKYSDEETLQRYIFNIELSASFNRAIHIFEVVLRNRLVECWNELLKTNNWPMSKVGIPSSEKYHEMIRDIDKAILRSGNSSENGKIVAELSLGFWLHLLDKKFQQQNIKMIKKVFSSKDSWNSNLVLDIFELRSQIAKIHLLRNRIAHHEPIFHYSDLRERFDLIKIQVGYLNPTCACLIDEERFSLLLKNGWKQIKLPS